MRWNTFGCSVIALLVAAACAKAPQVESTGVQGTAIEPVAAGTGAAFDCEGVQLLVSFEGDEVTLDLADGKLVLQSVEVATGAKYSDGTTTFWTQGEEATLARPDATRTCVVQPVRSVESKPLASE